MYASVEIIFDISKSRKHTSTFLWAYEYTNYRKLEAIQNQSTRIEEFKNKSKFCSSLYFLSKWSEENRNRNGIVYHFFFFVFQNMF